LEMLNVAVKKEKISLDCVLASVYFICMPLQIITLFAGVSVLKAVMFILAPIMIITLFFGEKKITFNSVHLFLALYLTYTLASLYLARDTATFDYLRAMFENSIVIFLVSIRIYNQREKKIIEYSWIVVGVICILIGFFSTVEMSDEERIAIIFFGSYEDPNQFCAYLILPILYAMKKITSKTALKPLYVAYILTMIYIAFKTGSRGGLVAIIVPMAVLAILLSKGFANKVRMIVSALLVAVFAIYVLFPMLPESVQGRFNIERIQEDRGSGRVGLWETTYQSIISDSKSMIFGKGINSTEEILLGAGFSNTVAHNHWLQIWSDQGIIAVFLYLFILMAGIFRTYKKNVVVMAAIWGMIALSMSLSLNTFKPFLNVILMSAMNFEGELTYDS